MALILTFCLAKRSTLLVISRGNSTEGCAGLLVGDLSQETGRYSCYLSVSATVNAMAGVDNFSP